MERQVSPVSKVRRKDKPIVATVSAAEKQRRDYRDYRRRERLRKLGFALIVVGVAIALEHAAAHLGAFGSQQPSALIDLTLGWPLAAVIVIVGMILAGQRRL